MMLRPGPPGNARFSGSDEPMMSMSSISRNKKYGETYSTSTIRPPTAIVPNQPISGRPYFSTQSGVSLPLRISPMR